MSNPFETLGVPARFDLDEADLHRRFIRLSSEHHPDRFTDALDQVDAAERSAVVNEAYRILRDPESRASALLTVLGGAAGGDDKDLPPGFLMDVMDVRERMDEAKDANDATALAEIQQWAAAQREEKLAEIRSLFAGNTPETRRDIRRALNALRYFQRMIE